MAPLEGPVTRPDLRADLAEMELRLRIYFDERLDAKADRSVVAENSSALRNFARGEFTIAQERSITALAEHVITAQADKGWTNRQRVFGVVALVITVLSFATSFYVSIQTTRATANVEQRGLIAEERR